MVFKKSQREFYLRKKKKKFLYAIDESISGSEFDLF